MIKIECFFNANAIRDDKHILFFEDIIKYYEKPSNKTIFFHNVECWNGYPKFAKWKVLKKTLYFQ